VLTDLCTAAFDAALMLPTGSMKDRVVTVVDVAHRRGVNRT
jgi:hypothetical protein